MKRLLLTVLALSGTVLLFSLSIEEKENYLQWMRDNLTDVPAWNSWQESAGELPPDFNKMPKSNLLPDPFVFNDGSKVSPEQWAERRAEIFSLFETYVPGKFPPKPSITEITIANEIKNNGYTTRDASVNFGPDGKGSVRIRLVIPDGYGDKMPALICPNLDGWSSVLIKRGYVSVGYAGNDFMDDAANLQEIYPDYDFATLPRRAWLAQVVMDYLETVPEVDISRVAIFGYSRDGKIAMLATAIDERISAVIAGSTGVGGAVPWRFAGERGGGESIESTTRMFPDWFLYRLRYFSGKEDYLPVDANLLISLIAPRAALLQWGYTDQVANGWAMEQAYHSAKKVYDLTGNGGRLGLLPMAGFHGSNDQDRSLDWLDYQFGKSDIEWWNEFIFLGILMIGL
ncbi:MAG: hypothetical protein LIO79_05255 [Rikenellaceae bacterium]|nr:hypothetical protein [Rikenellaceae bacterium]